MKDAGKIALGVVLAIGQAAVVLLVQEIRQDLRELRADQAHARVVTGSLITWARTKGYQPYQEE